MSAAEKLDQLLADLAGKRVLVYSLGLEGQDLARWFLDRGAAVTMCDTRSPEQLAAAGALPPVGVQRVVVGRPLLDPSGFDLVATSQALLRSNAALQRARELGIPVVSQLQLILRLARGRVIGITGSSGKSTTTALVGAIARAAGADALVGGNLGEPLLARLDERPNAELILEISHTQLQYTDRSPQIGALTNVTPNHLDQFSWEEYVELKRHLFAYQGPDDVAILNADDPVSRSLASSLQAQVRWVSTRCVPDRPAAFATEGEIVAIRDGEPVPVLSRAELRLRGEHNVANATMATAVASVAGYPLEAIREALRTFRGLPHRLELVGAVRGVTFVDDSIATTPERTLAALGAFEEPVVLLLGGREKHLPLDELRRRAAERVRAAVCFGESADTFANALEGQTEVRRCRSLEEAVQTAANLARPGDVVLLSPAATSFDAFPNFAARGEAFKRIVRALPGFEEVP